MSRTSPLCGPGSEQPGGGRFDTAPCQRAWALVQGLTLVLEHANAPKPVRQSFRDQVLPYLTVDSESVFFKRAKYLTCAPMARYLKNEAPAAPDQDIEFSGSWARWSKSRMLTNVSNTHLWYSFLQAKRAAMPATEGIVFETYQKHRAAMEVDDPGLSNPEIVDSVLSELEPLLKQVRSDVIRDVGLRETTFRECQLNASTRACFESSRSKGGAIGYIARRCGVRGVDYTRVVPGVRRVSMGPMPDLVRMLWFPVAKVNGVLVTNYLHCEYEYAFVPRGKWEEFFQQQVPAAMVDRPVYCMIQGVLEPLKVRVISKGEAVPYYLSRVLQKALWAALQKWQCFSLTGRPLDESHFDGLISNRVPGDDPGWASIDYAAATDNLSAVASHRALSSIISGLPLERVYERVLAPHRCSYPRVPGQDKIEDVDQKNGQLMGSVLSFPILCLLNLGLYLHVTKVAGDQRPIWDRMCGVLVNGDDMLYCANRFVYDIHVREGRKLGLEMSQGKAYWHPVVANVNSTCYHQSVPKIVNARALPPETWGRLGPRRIPFLNSGLFFGQGKVMGGHADEDAQRPDCKVARINELLKGCRPGRRAWLLRRYLVRHGLDIARETSCVIDGVKTVRNLFLPECLGGMGVVLFSGWKTAVTPLQMSAAAALYERNRGLWFGPHWEACFPDDPDPRQYPPPEPDDRVKAPWLAPEREKGERVLPGIDVGDSGKRLLKVLRYSLRGKPPGTLADLDGLFVQTRVHRPSEYSPMDCTPDRRDRVLADYAAIQSDVCSNRVMVNAWADRAARFAEERAALSRSPADSLVNLVKGVVFRNVMTNLGALNSTRMAEVQEPMKTWDRMYSSYDWHSRSYEAGGYGIVDSLTICRVGGLLSDDFVDNDLHIRGGGLGPEPMGLEPGEEEWFFRSLGLAGEEFW